MEKVVSTSLLVEMLCKKNSTKALAERHFITQESDLPEQNHSDDAKQENRNVGGRPKTGAFEVSQREAAEIVHVSERTIRDWDNGRKTPQGYPGRGNAIVFRQFAETYKTHQSQVRMAKAMNRAVSGGYSGDEVLDEEADW